MDAKQSNLSSANYGYDMVVATTQNSINLALKEFLSSFNTKEINICYAYDLNGDLQAVDYATLVKQAGVDPYSIASGSYHKSDPVAKLDDAGFAFAFRAKMGLPDMPPEKLPDIIVLNKGNEIVTYQMYCQEFSILNLEESGGGRNLTWTNISQPAGNPWIFSMNVNLDLRPDNSSDAFSKLPVNVQNTIKNLNPDSAFSVQQLYVDLNTAGLDSLPAIVGLDKDSNAFTYLTKVFINNYFSNLSSGKVILGYSVQPAIYNPNPQQPSVIPTDINIEISPNLNANGDASAVYGLYTLNYLVMSNKDKMPAPVQFTWNWVEDSQALDFHGAMSIKRAVFANYLGQKLSPWLATICLVPSVRVWLDSGVKFDASATATTSPQTYVLHPSGPELLTFSYHSDAYDQAGLDGLLGTLKVSCDISSTISCSGSRLSVDTTATFFMDISLASGHGTGNALKYVANLAYDFGVDDKGNIIVTPVKPDIQDLSDGVNSDAWGSIVNFFTGGELQDLINKIKGFLHDDSFLIDKFDEFVRSTLQNNNFWVFPGGKTFVFKDVFFSDSQDMVTHITYADPS